MKSWQQVLLYRQAIAEGNPITWEQAAQLAALKQAELRRSRAIDQNIFDQEYDALKLGIGRPLRAKEN
jgi:hypothetical protein